MKIKNKAKVAEESVQYFPLLLNIKKTSKAFSDKYFKNRNAKKNALSISSNQSKIIESYEMVKKKYQAIIDKEDLFKRPSYWGGYEFSPYYFEFWEGHSSRLNKREVFVIKNNNVSKHFLEP